MYQTGIGTNLLLMTLISFVVGLSISGQTFYTFILENIDRFGALKAIGAKGRELVAMILFQATFVALTGYGLGRRPLRAPHLARPRAPAGLRGDRSPSRISGLAFVMVVVIAALSSYIGVRKVLRIEPFDIFRG